MGKIITFLMFLPLISTAQLTVDKIMQDPKWIGTSPSNIIWSYDSHSIYFQWNPEKHISDSAYKYSLADNKISKATYIQKQLAEDIANGTLNKAKTAMAFIHNNDVYMITIATGKIMRITQTEDFKNVQSFANNDSDVIYTLNDNVFSWNIYNGITKQLTNFIKSSPPPVNHDTQQEQWLKNEALRTSSVIKRRSDKADSAKAFLDSNKEKDLRKIYIGKKEFQQLTISPDERFIAYSLYEKNDAAKETVVPAYVTKEGFTKDIPGRTKAGRPEGDYSFFVFDKLKDTVIAVATDSIVGIYDKPEFLKNYPDTNKNAKPVARKVIVQGPYWNDAATAAFVDIVSLDFKDRWLMQLNAVTGKLLLIDRQHDSAWIAGPGIAWLEPGNVGWINNSTIYFQSEATGYSQLYAYNLNTHQHSAITSGNYEIQKAILSSDKKYFYLVTNEEHPGKQSIYRINNDGSNKIKLTSFTGQYEMFLSPDEKHLAYRYSYQNKPWELFYQSVKTTENPTQVTDKAMSDSFKAYPWRDTKIFTFTARDSAQVYARIYEPKEGTKNNAAVIFVHGAGYLQNVDYGWSYYFHEMMFNNLLADKGYTVMDIDYRASEGYGRNWRTAIYRYMGGKDLDDEVDAAHYLVHYLGIDSTRIGMYGGSYGGFMTLMAMFTKPDVFKAGAALRSVTDWAHYDHGYTAAILNEPFTDSIAYAHSSPINFASGLKNHLLICHGMVDENVHFQDDVRLVQRLIELGKDNWELAVYPVEDHGFIEPSSWTDEYKRILKLFDDNLLMK